MISYRYFVSSEDLILRFVNHLFMSKTESFGTFNVIEPSLSMLQMQSLDSLLNHDSLPTN